MSNPVYHHTLVLPAKDQPAAQALQAAVDDVSSMLMLMFGREPELTAAVAVADALCERGSSEDGCWRKVVWVPDRTLPTVAATLARLPGLDPKAWVSALDFQREVKVNLSAQSHLDEIHLEDAFMEAGG